MKGTDKTKKQLIDELNSLSQRITELEAAEAEHKRIEQDVRLPAQILDEITHILESAQDPIFIHDVKGDFVYVNEAAALSHAYTKEELLKTNLHELNTQESSGPFERHMKKVLEEGDAICEIAHHRKDGSVLPLEINTRAVEIDGNMVLFSAARDITERKRAEETLRDREARYRYLFEHSQVANALVGLDGTVIDANQAAAELYGYEKSEIIGRNVLEFFTPDSGIKAAEAIARGLQGAYAEPMEFDVLTKKGPRKFFFPGGYHVVVEGGKEKGFLISAVDITEQKKAEDALKYSEEKYRSIVETGGAGVLVGDLSGNITFVNESFCKILGYGQEELEGKPFANFLHPDDKAMVLEKFAEGLAHPDAGYKLEFRAIHKDGRVVWIYPSVSPVFYNNALTAGMAIAFDITERKQLEEAVKKSEARYRTILDEMEDGYFEVDIAGNFTFVNDANCRQLGYSREELIGMNYRKIIASDDTENVYRSFNQVYRGGQPVRDFIFKTVRKDGSIGQGELSVFPILSEKGDIIGFRGIGRDIVGRLQMIEDLRRSEERYRTVLEEMEEAYYELNLAGNLTFFNDALVRKGGRSREELMGMGYKKYTPAKDLERVYKAFNQVYKTGKPLKGIPLQVIRDDGTIISSEDTILPLRNKVGEIIGFRGVSHDVTERLQMMEALRRSEERYRTMLDEMEEAYYEVDLTGNFTFFSDALCRQLGYSREEIMGLSYRVYTPPENAKKVFEVYNTVYRTGEPLKSFASSQIKKDGTRVYTEDSIFPLRDEEGKIIGFRGISRDVTDRKQRDEERKQLEQKAQFASRLASVGELASGVAHEINNPLTAVIGYAHLLLDRKDIPADIKRDVEVINEGAQRVAGIIKKLLVFARQTKPERTYVDVNEIINTTLELRAYSLQSNNIKVILQLNPELPMTVADPGQLQQVFLNLIMNAETEVKLVHGGGKLSIRTEQIGDNIRVSFKDNGLGIAKENLERIFNPFFTTRKVGQGTGLGLSVCHGIVTEHKGRIWAESQLGKGASFIVELPIVNESKQLEMPEPVVRETRKAVKARILVVDDETVIQQFVSQILTEEGHEVEAVDSAEDALEEVNNKKYQAIMLDIKMPGMSGIELYQHFQKTSPPLADKVVFITGDVMGPRTIAFLSKTKAPYIIKPFDATQLKAEINRILTGE
jgi:PAS domain S-box-containing protein